MQRNFQIVSHLISGDDSPSGTENPKRWRRWKMPAGDFSLLIVDSRLWRSFWKHSLWGSPRRRKHAGMESRPQTAKDSFRKEDSDSGKMKRARNHRVKRIGSIP